MRILSEDHRLLQESVAGYLAENGSIKLHRHLRDTKDTLRYSKELANQMADMGIFGIMLPESVGGTDMGAEAAGLVAEQLGKNLTAAPFMSTAVLAATILRSAGGNALEEWGPKIATGCAVFSLAIEERTKHRSRKFATHATADGNGFVLSGHKQFALDATQADQLIVAANLDGKTALFLVDPLADGCEIEPRLLLNNRNTADLTLDNIRLPGSAYLGTMGQGQDILDSALRVGRAVSTAEQMGSAYAASATTFEYLKERKQFGVKIGSFQALQHRAAHLYTQIELASALTVEALKAIDWQDDGAEKLSRAAKVKSAQVGRLATEEASQMHGGVGMTDALDIGFT